MRQDRSSALAGKDTHGRVLWRVAADVLLARRLVDPDILDVHVNRPQGAQAVKVDGSEVLGERNGATSAHPLNEPILRRTGEMPKFIIRYCRQRGKHVSRRRRGSAEAPRLTIASYGTGRAPT